MSPFLSQTAFLSTFFRTFYLERFLEGFLSTSLSVFVHSLKKTYSRTIFVGNAFLSKNTALSSFLSNITFLSAYLSIFRVLFPFSAFLSALLSTKKNTQGTSGPYSWWILMGRRFRICVPKGGGECFRLSYVRPRFILFSRKNAIFDQKNLLWFSHGQIFNFIGINMKLSGINQQC